MSITTASHSFGCPRIAAAIQRTTMAAASFGGDGPWSPLVLNPVSANDGKFAVPEPAGRS